jgi:hypothetical protein
MMLWQPHQVVIITPRGLVVVARRLYERLEARIQPDDLGLLRDFDWWQQLSQLVGGIEITTSASLGRKHP